MTTFEEFKDSIQTLPDLDKLLEISSFCGDIRCRIRIQEDKEYRETIERNGRETKKENVEKLRLDLSSTLQWWREVFNKVYSEWESMGYDPEKVYPHPSYPGFVPKRKKTLQVAKSKALRDIKYRKKEVPNRTSWNRKKEK